MKNWYYLEMVTPSKDKPWVIELTKVDSMGEYTNLNQAIRDANAYLRGYNRAIMGEAYMRIVTTTPHLLEIRRYGYRYDGKAYKWKLNRKPIPY